MTKPTATPALIAASRDAAVEAWHAANKSANEFTATDLGAAVRAYAEHAGLGIAEAMEVVRQAGQAEIDAEAAAQDPAAARKAAWARLVNAYRADKAEASEATSAELGAASFAYGEIVGLPAEEAFRNVRTAIWRKDVGPRSMMVSYMSPEGAFGASSVVIDRPLEDMRDVMEVQAELRKLNLIPATAVMMGWSQFDTP